MTKLRGFTILEFLLVSFLASGLLAAALPILQDVKNLAAEQLQLSELLTREQLLYSLLANSIHVAGSFSCTVMPTTSALVISGRELVHDSSVNSSNNLLLLSGCALYNSQPHWLQIAYFIAKKTNKTALYSKIVRIDNIAVTLPKIELVSGVAKLQFLGCSICGQKWCCNNRSASATVVVVSAQLKSRQAIKFKRFPDTNLPIYVNNDGYFIARAVWDFRPDLL